MAKKKDFKSATLNTMDKFFSEAQYTPSENISKEVNGSVPEKKETRSGRKTDTHKPFSFWAEKDEADEWRLWAKAKKIKVDDLGTQAIREYIKRHKLTEDQQKLYDLMKKS